MRTGRLEETIAGAVDSKIRYVELSGRHAFVCTDRSLSVFERGVGTGTGGSGGKRVLRMEDFAGMGPIYRILLPEMPKVADGCTYVYGEGESARQSALDPKMAIVPQMLEPIYATNVITQQDGYYAGMYGFVFLFFAC